MPEGIDLGVSGLASGFDWRSLVDQLADVERAPQKRMLQDQQSIQERKTAYASIATQLTVLRNRITDLTSGTLFGSRGVTVSDTTLATATVASGAALGRYAFHITQLATAANRQGTADIGAALSSTNDLSNLKVSDAAFSVPVKAGTFTVNGQQITIATSDKLGDVFSRISTATGGDVTASYDSTTDRISLTSASNSEIVLGTSTDSSNFLQSAKLANNGASTVSSSARLGTVRTGQVLTSANLTTAITDGGAGAGKLKINGVEIAYNASKDTISDVLKRINDSDAGVVASYDTVNDRFSLTNESTGDVGIALQDVTGNFLSATGLSASSLTHGKDLLYTVNGGGQLSSHSNTIDESTSGLTGLSVSVLDQQDFTVTVATDKDKIKKALTDFVDDYNRVQALIDTNTASTTDAKGKVAAGTLASESDAFNISSDLRRIIMGPGDAFTGAIKRFDQLGIESSGDNNNLTLADSTTLDDALTNNLTGLEDFFLNSTNGIATKLDTYLESMVGDDGKLGKKATNLDTQIADLTKQMAAQEKQVQDNRQRLVDQFVSMEQAQLQINQQLQYLQKRFT